MENELSRVVDVLPGLIWTALPDGTVDFVNQGWCAYTGMTPDAACGRGWLASIHPDDLPALLERWQAILASGEARDMAARLRRFDGAYRRFVLRVRPLADASGKVVKWCGVNVETAPRQQADEAAPAPEPGFAAIADNIPALVALMTPDGAVDYVNRHALEYLGATLDELKGWQAGDTVHPDDLPAVIAAWTQAVDSGQPYDIEHRIRGADGSYRWFHVRGLPLRGADGCIRGWCVVEVDIDETKRSEALLASTLGELAASEDRLRAIIDTVPGFVWRAAPDGSVEFLNQRWCDYTGIGLQESLGIGWTSRIHPDDAPALGSYWQALLEASQPGVFEARLRRFDGVYRWFLIRAVPLLDDAGRVLKWYGQNTDIDDRKRAEALLEGEKRLLRLIAEGTPLAQVLAALCALAQSSMDGAWCGVALIDPRHARAPQEASLRLQPGTAPDVPGDLLDATDGRPLEPQASPAAWSASRGEPAISADLRSEARWSTWCSAALAHGIRANWSTPIRSSCGATVGVFSLLLREAKAPEPFHDNLLAQFTHLASIAIERTRGEAALRKSESFLAKTQRLSLTGTVAWRVDTDEILWSDELYRIYEFAPGVTLTHDLINTRIHPEDIPAHDDMLRRQRRHPGDFESEHRLLMPDGRVKFLHLVGHLTRDEEGGLEYVSAVQDVTQRRLAAEALGKVRSELTHVARVASLGTLTASIAHEVNQPLSGIITNANTCLRMLAADPPNVEGACETARRTIRDGNRASDVIKRLRALFAKKKVASETLDLNEAAREVIAMLLGELQRNGVTLHPEFADDVPPVSGDRVQLQQVILNLILNASDAMGGVVDRPRRMLIRTAREGTDRIRLSVQDAGAGFDPRDADRLFNAFYTTKAEGMGIGLSVSRSIIEAHDGRLWAMANGDGPGATFAFSIPCLPETITAAGPDAPADSNRTLESS